MAQTFIAREPENPGLEKRNEWSLGFFFLPAALMFGQWQNYPIIYLFIFFIIFLYFDVF